MVGSQNTRRCEEAGRKPNTVLNPIHLHARSPFSDENRLRLEAAHLPNEKPFYVQTTTSSTHCFNLARSPLSQGSGRAGRADSFELARFN